MLKSISEQDDPGSRGFACAKTLELNPTRPSSRASEQRLDGKAVVGVIVCSLDVEQAAGGVRQVSGFDQD